MRKFSPRFSPLSLCLIVLLLANNVWAWGSKEHIQLTRLAIERIIADPTAPADLKAWLKTNTPDMGSPEQERNYFMTAHVGVEASNDLKGFSYWVIQPDVRAGIDMKAIKSKTPLVPVAPLGVAEHYWHFIDMELLNDDPDHRRYHDNLSSMPDITKAVHDIKDVHYQKETGVLPFAIEASYKMLVDELKAGRLQPPAGKPLDEDNALKWAASLSHYLEDNTQPMHATEDFLGLSYFADRRHALDPHSVENVHSQVEYAMVDDAKHDYPQLRADFWKQFSSDLATFKDPIQTEDLFVATLQVAKEGYRVLPLIGRAAMYASGQGGTPDKPVGRAGPIDTEKFFRFQSDVLGGKPTTLLEVKAQRQAWAVVRVARELRRAWDESHAK